MLFQVVLNIIAFFVKLAVWIAVAFLAVPFGIYMFLINYFRSFVLEYGFGFWSVFTVLTIIAYIILWKPILWIVSSISVLSAGQQNLQIVFKLFLNLKGGFANINCIYVCKSILSFLLIYLIKVKFHFIITTVIYWQSNNFSLKK